MLKACRMKNSNEVNPKLETICPKIGKLMNFEMVLDRKSCLDQWTMVVLFSEVLK